MTESAVGQTVRMSRMRTAIGHRMSQSKREAPHFYVEAEIDMGAAQGLLSSLSAATDGAKITVTTVIAAGIIRCLEAHPEFNSVWAGTSLIRVEAVNLGIAVSLPDGLIAPAIIDCAGLGVEPLSVRFNDLVARARGGRLRTSEVSDGTFTLSNLGMFRVTAFTAIITPPQVATLAAGRIIDRPVVRDGTVTIRPIMTATLSCDHRAVDGSDGARFLETLQGLLEKPAYWASGSAQSEATTNA